MTGPMQHQQFVIPAPPQSAVGIVSTDWMFPVRRIYCVGRNYAEHAREMGSDGREPPFFFQKPADAILRGGSALPYPPLTQDLHHEVELVAAIKIGGRNIEQASAHQHVFGLAVGIDFTRRDLQAVAKKNGRPWEIGKAFDHSAAIAPLTPLDAEGLPTAGAISLSVNGAERQRGDIADMVWGLAEVIATLSTHYTLAPGDLIYTGTPAGVGPVVVGDQVTAEIAQLSPLEIRVVDPE